MAKVILIGPAHPLRGGLASFNERLARQYLSQGDEMIIYTFSLQYPGFLFPGKTQYSDDPRPDDLDIRVKVNSVNPLNWLKVGHEIKKLDPDLVILRFWLPFMGPCLGTISRIIKGNGNTRIVAITDNVIPHEKRPGDALFTSYFLNSVDGFITMSQAVMEDLGKFDKIKPRLRVLHPLYDNFGPMIPREQACKALNLDPSYKYMLFFGMIRDYKGLDWLLEAFADSRFREMKLKLIVAGEFYIDSKPFDEQIAKYNLQDCVLMHTHFIPTPDVGKYFGACDLIVQPYKNATQSGVSQIAYHFLLPTIITNVSGLPENIPDGRVGFVSEPNPKAVADAIFRYYSENREADFRENMKEERKKFSWAILTEKIAEVAAKV